MTLGQQPRYRCIFAVDVENSTTRNNRAKARMRDAMYEVVLESFALAGVPGKDVEPLIDRGDGLLALIHPTDQVPKTLLLQSVIHVLGRLMILHNSYHPADRFRLRTVLHAGEVHYDSRAPFGASLDLAFRLLDAPETKRALRQTPAPLVLVVSDDIYWSVVSHQYDGIDPLSFNRFATEAHKNTWNHGWLHVPVRTTSSAPAANHVARLYKGPTDPRIERNHPLQVSP